MPCTVRRLFWYCYLMFETAKHTSHNVWLPVICNSSLFGFFLPSHSNLNTHHLQQLFLSWIVELCDAYKNGSMSVFIAHLFHIFYSFSSICHLLSIQLFDFKIFPCASIHILMKFLCFSFVKRFIIQKIDVVFGCE